MLLVIDNYDSFTFNIVRYFKELGEVVRVIENDALEVDAIAALKAEKIVISPGPKDPNAAGISVPVIERFAGHIPILGVCLGHQCIGQAFGATVVRAGSVMHGKTSVVYHHGSDIYRDLPQAFCATRYHSLVLDQDTLPPCLVVTAWTQGDSDTAGEIMGIRHRDYPIFGVQFHPESILSEHGHQIFKNFLGI